MNTDPLKPWVRNASGGRTVAHTADQACGHREDWQDLACDFQRGHPDTMPDGRPLLHDGHNSALIAHPIHLDAVNRVKRYWDHSSPLDT